MTHLPHSEPGEAQRVLALTVCRAHIERFFPGELLGEIRSLLGSWVEIDSSALSPEDWLEWLIENDPEVLVTGWGTPELPDAFLSETRNLRYVCNLTGTIRSIVPSSYIEKGIQVTNWGNAISPVVAEAGLMLILAALRRLVSLNYSMRDTCSWREGADGIRTLHGKHVGIHGFGNLARSLVHLLAPFDVKISVYSPFLPEAEFGKCKVIRCTNLEKLFAENDVVVEAEGLSRETIGMIGRKHLSLLADNSVFVNIGRADVIQEDALIEAAMEGRFQIGLDVYHQEPLPVDHVFRKLTNVTLYPHQAGPTPDSYSLLGMFALRNLKAFSEGRPLQAQIDLERLEKMT